MVARSTISLASAIEKNRISSDVAYLVCLVVEVRSTTGTVIETMRLVNNSEDITYKGNVFVAMPFNIELKGESGSQPQIQLSITDYTRAVIEKMNQYGGGIGFDVTVMVVRSNALNDEPDVKEYFKVTSASASNYVISFTLGAENILIMRFPKRVQLRQFCHWVFKDQLTCKYSGPQTVCDRTLNGTAGCRTRNNVINFGGFPGIVSNGTSYR